MMTLNEVWVRIIDYILTAAAFAVIASILICASRAIHGMFRTAFVLSISFTVTTAINALCMAWDLYSGGNCRLAMFIHPVAALTKIVFAVYCWKQFGKFVIVLRGADMYQKLLIDDETDRVQRRWNLAYVVSTTKERALALMSAAKRDQHGDSSTTVGVHTR